MLFLFDQKTIVYVIQKIARLLVLLGDYVLKNICNNLHELYLFLVSLLGFFWQLIDLFRFRAVLVFLIFVHF